MYVYAANNPIKYTDPDGRNPFCIFDKEEYIRQQLNAQTAEFEAATISLFGKIGNAIINIFTGKAKYQIYANASLDILGFKCDIFDFKIGSKGEDLSFSVQQKYVDEFLEKFEKLAEAPITLTSSKLKVKVKNVSFTIETDGNNLKVNVNLGKSKSLDFGALGKGSISINAGMKISVNMNEGPLGTIKNGKSSKIEQAKLNYNYLKSLNRLSDYIHINRD